MEIALRLQAKNYAINDSEIFLQMLGRVLQLLLACVRNEVKD